MAARRCSVEEVGAAYEPRGRGDVDAKGERMAVAGGAGAGAVVGPASTCCLLEEGLRTRTVVVSPSLAA